MRKGRFAQPGRAVEQDMVHRLPSLAGGLNEDLQVFQGLFLAGKIVKGGRAQSLVGFGFVPGKFVVNKAGHKTKINGKGRPFGRPLQSL